VQVHRDSKKCKEILVPTIKDDLINHHANDLVEENSSKLAGLGYGSQIYPRTINFFYVGDNLRERIVFEDDKYKVLNTDLEFSREEIINLAENEPNKFSPNVVLRPLYQQLLLPNLAYVGGPSEIAYWLQLKPVFDHYNAFYPVLLPRNCALILNSTSTKKVRKTGLSITELFQDLESLKSDFIRQNAENEFSLSDERKSIGEVFEAVKKKTKTIDQSLVGFVGAEENKIHKILENVEKRLKKAEESKLETSIKQIEWVKDNLFPEGVLQERHDNFLNFYLNNPDFIDELIEEFDPFQFKMHVLIDS
jgi:bacillithiol biosynthesis cysteine-adding enzyme BshC